MNFKYFKISILGALLPFMAIAQTANITITGKIDPSHNGEKVRIIYGLTLRNIRLDSATVTNGHIAFNLPNVPPQVVTISNGKKIPFDRLSIYVNKENITLTTRDSLKLAVVKGDKLTEDYSRMNAAIVKLQDQEYEYMAKLSAIPVSERKTNEAALSIMANQQDIKLRISEATYAAIDANPNSYISFEFLKNITGGTIKYDLAMPHFSKLSPEIRNSKEGKEFETKILLVKNLRSGLKAANFESTTPDGAKLSLQDVIAKGKYTLIDFWASWCVPCRAENPNVVEAYNNYHNKGLNILSVSLDTKADAWKAAIAKDGMPWNHVSGLIGFKEPAAVLYGIQAIPQNVLVDANGTIVATNLRGPDLQQKLKQIFAQ
ncbi:thiol-disulfide isomerase/thioredoxin [Mucilaginibacter gracilis]|uniref:Thiol-disulfide isomerase/thioredoxin n=1 Tax=Mucilaginibacter gracilis TaxID=423350 RepID=A0A495J4T8_9SPHI|nr:TlpA disulfide reductase family protein [Mucilaginibacter gracilis]RKR84006.1 thiol-disulfide isomerase/thioredoxin [Mucilaginibacter gracilis]